MRKWAINNFPKPCRHLIATQIITEPNFSNGREQIMVLKASPRLDLGYLGFLFLSIFLYFELRAISEGCDCMLSRPQASSAVAFDALQKKKAKSALPHSHPPFLTLAHSLGFLTLFISEAVVGGLVRVLPRKVRVGGQSCIKAAHWWLHSMQPFISVTHIMLMNVTSNKPQEGGQHEFLLTALEVLYEVLAVPMCPIYHFDQGRISFIWNEVAVLSQ